MADGFYRSKDSTNSIKVLQEKATKKNNSKTTDTTTHREMLHGNLYRPSLVNSIIIDHFYVIHKNDSRHRNRWINWQTASGSLITFHTTTIWSFSQWEAYKEMRHYVTAVTKRRQDISHKLKVVTMHLLKWQHRTMSSFINTRGNEDISVCLHQQSNWLLQQCVHRHQWSTDSEAPSHPERCWLSHHWGRPDLDIWHRYCFNCTGYHYG